VNTGDSGAENTRIHPTPDLHDKETSMATPLATQTPILPGANTDSEKLATHLNMAQSKLVNLEDEVLATARGRYASLMEIFERLSALTADMDFKDCTVTVTPSAGKYEEVLQQQEDGSWTFHRTIWSRETA
jgi:hypothetical protein